jgi:hypothetical protein
LTWNASDETAALELHDHLVDGGWGDLEKALEVGLSRGLTVDQMVGMEER